MPWQPLEDQMLVEPEMMPETSTGGIALPIQSREALPYGLVIAVGPRVENVRVGEVVAFLPFAGTPLDDEGTTFICLRERDILARRT